MHRNVRRPRFEKKKNKALVSGSRNNLKEKPTITTQTKVETTRQEADRATSSKRRHGVPPKESYTL